MDEAATILVELADKVAIALERGVVVVGMVTVVLAVGSSGRPVVIIPGPTGLGATLEFVLMIWRFYLIFLRIELGWCDRREIYSYL